MIYFVGSEGWRPSERAWFVKETSTIVSHGSRRMGSTTAVDSMKPPITTKFILCLFLSLSKTLRQNRQQAFASVHRRVIDRRGVKRFECITERP